jgi:hypothetical protein
MRTAELSLNKRDAHAQASDVEAIVLSPKTEVKDLGRLCIRIILLLVSLVCLGLKTWESIGTGSCEKT